MAICYKYAGKANTATMDFSCEETSQIADLPSTIKKGTGVFANYQQFCREGSTCVCANGNGSVIVYQLFAEPIGWKQL